MYIEMAQRSILLMLINSIDQLGKTVQNKTMLGQLVRNDTISQLGKPADTLSENQTGDPIVNFERLGNLVQDTISLLRKPIG